MTKTNVSIHSVTLAYFSGTGGTKKIVDCFQREWINQGCKVNLVNIGKQEGIPPKATDLLMVFSPVYAFRMAKIVETWVKQLPRVKRQYAAIISVSGGGAVSPNTACRVASKKALIQKGYTFLYEDMMVMPTNFFIQASPGINYQLLRIIPVKVNHIMTDILSGKTKRIRPKRVDRLFSLLGKLEHLGAAFFGASIKATNACNQCGKCVKNCPKHNIKMKNGIPVFGWHCLWCMKCIYSCEAKALSPKYLKCVVLKDGFDLKRMEQKPKKLSVRKKSAIQRILWGGVMRYIKD
ncbi:MAG: hypothetical protein PWP24_266 [Clostridiales bacterium]|nr:hypothetical protein [Clostridiales bacterium]